MYNRIELGLIFTFPCVLISVKSIYLSPTFAAFPISLEGPSLNFATSRVYNLLFTCSCSETFLTLLIFDGISSSVGSCAPYNALKGL